MQGWKKHVKDLLFDYEQNKADLDYLLQDLEGSCLSAQSISGMPRGGGTSDPTHDKAMELIHNRPTERLCFLEKAVNAVDRAIAITERKIDGAAMVRVFKMVYFDRTHTLYGAGISVPISEREARNWNTEFIKLLGQIMGWC